MDYNHVYKKVENYVVALYERNLNPNLLYHNLEHTRGVVSKTKEIAGHYDLSERNTLIVYVAAWFHDIGYLYTQPSRHEEKSCELMRKFMVELGVEIDVIEETTECIMATKSGTQPTNLCQEILKDADTYHLGTKEFKRINKLVLGEFELTDPAFDRTHAIDSAVNMLEKHKYYTSYCRELLTENKRKNMSKLKKKLIDEEQEATEIESKRMQLGGEKNALVTKGIQTMLRLTSENQMKLSDMADNKANILISVNAIIISVIFAVLLRRLQYESYLTIPTVIFLVVSVVTIVISILATRPKLSSGTFSEQDIINKKTNLLFFGNFHKASFEEYESAMITMMKDPDYLYRSVVKDIYYLAVVLGRKYKLIRLAYNIFMVGIIVSVLAFGIATFFFSKGTTIITNTQSTPL